LTHFFHASKVVATRCAAYVATEVVCRRSLPGHCVHDKLVHQAGCFPKGFKTAQVLPLLKKPSLDPANFANFRPISNLSTISKVVERLALRRLGPYLTGSPRFNLMQSAYRPGHSTETALLSIFNDIYTNVDTKKLTVIVALDISAAFDTICHAKLLDRLQHVFGVKGWFESYLTDHRQFVKLGRFASGMT
jgi:hypothetical protein